MSKNVEFHSYSVNVKTALKDKAIAFLHEIGGEIKSQAQRNSRRKTSQTGETAEMEINFLEITKDIIKSAIIGVDGTSKDTNYDLIESKADVEDGDYLQNIAFVGKTLGGKNIIVIMDNALCTSGLGVSVVMEVVSIIMKNLPSCKNEIYTFLSGLSGMTVKEIGNLDMVTFTEMIVAVVQKQEFKDFFKVVSKLFK